MKKNIQNLGKSLTKNQQKEINGGQLPIIGQACTTNADCSAFGGTFGWPDVYCKKRNRFSQGTCQFTYF
ncbi:hypothetical protein [Tenacibaculum sp. M341]|uniref:hypothetical protein n=1 Tax=Tenacibaculum sp. M341 TaxID=2530339 RepID=UPI00104499BC|nr:hypothetical protein [Tenacibaculum sp. M341]TCI93733.1 hypothetical protein EYW44_04770 [Tenacibaculum sp. M341]